ncbi:MAG: GNAT family N-acetyltransferase [Myxococcota bacterium]
MSQFIQLAADDLDSHHLCCALGDKKHEAGVAAKKAWLRERLAEGLVFRKLDVRGKVFIEYAPAEVAWRPIDAPGWLVVHCLWVSGSYTKQGYGRALVESCIEDARAQGRTGVVVAAAKRKRPFLANPRFLKHLGFEVVDERGEFRLFAYRCQPDGPDPRFTDAVPNGNVADNTFVARYTDQCPFNLHWAHRVVADLEALGHTATVERVTTLEGARMLASPLGCFSLEQGEELVSHHLTTTGATTRLLDRRRGIGTKPSRR